MKIRYFNQNGEQIKTAVDPAYLYRNNKEKDRPQDFVIIKQKEFEQPIIDPFGNESIIQKLSDPVEEVYCRWVWSDGSWYCTISAVIKEGQFVLDRRPEWWKFVENFKRPDLRR